MKTKIWKTKQWVLKGPACRTRFLQRKTVVLFVHPALFCISRSTNRDLWLSFVVFIYCNVTLVMNWHSMFQQHLLSLFHKVWNLRIIFKSQHRKHVDSAEKHHFINLFFNWSHKLFSSQIFSFTWQNFSLTVSWKI